MQSPKKEKKPAAGLAALAVVVIAALGQLPEGTGGAAVGVLMAVLLLMAALIAVIKAKKKAPAKAKVPVFRPKAEEDCHNRLHPEHAAQCSDPGTHWKRQLDGFLAAGIIEKDEYRVLLERHTRQTKP